MAQANLKVVLRRTDRNAAKTDRTEGPRNCIGVAATRVDAAATSEKVDEAEAAAAKRRARKLKPNALGEIVRDKPCQLSFGGAHLQPCFRKTHMYHWAKPCHLRWHARKGNCPLAAWNCGLVNGANPRIAQTL